MKRFRLGTLMLLITITALCLALAKQVWEVSRSNVDFDFRFAELHRIFILLIFVVGFALAKRAREDRVKSGALAFRLEAMDHAER